MCGDDGRDEVELERGDMLGGVEPVARLWGLGR